jgi:hypothetical protein
MTLTNYSTLVVSMLLHGMAQSYQQVLTMTLIQKIGLQWQESALNFKAVLELILKRVA